MTDKEMTPEEYFALPSHERSLYSLISSLNGDRKYEPGEHEHSMSIRLDMFNYPRIKTISEYSGKSFNRIINDMLDVGYATMLSSMSEEDVNHLKAHVITTTHHWLKEKTESKK